jgi:hypothetical protein
MLSLSTKTKLKPEQVIKQAVDFFGLKGYKLNVTNQSSEYVAFEGGGGGVEVNTSVEGKQTSVDLVSREWDFQVREFMGKLK